MTDDLNELRRLAEAARPEAGYIGILVKVQASPSMIAFIATANPATILSLLDRVERAEAAVEIFAREETAARSAIPSACQLDLPDGGDVSLPEAISRFAETSRNLARRAALEEAAKVAEGMTAKNREYSVRCWKDGDIEAAMICFCAALVSEEIKKDIVGLAKDG